MEELQPRLIEVDEERPLYRDWLLSPKMGVELENWAEKIATIQEKIFPEQSSQVKKEPPQQKKSRLFKTVLAIACGAAVAAMTLGIPAAFGVLTLGVINSVGDGVKVWQRGKRDEKESLIQQVIDALKDRRAPPKSYPNLD